jgi:putative transposase
MPRTARLSYRGGVFHVVSRFARDEWWLDRDGGRDAYLASLERAAERSDAEVLAYCLMSNHVHLVVVQGEAPLERLMKSVHTGFASWAQRSRRSGRVLGPVFAGRPRTLLVEQDAYLLELVRYVHNNPVRAKVARAARSSVWSSHQAYIGHVEAPGWLRMGYVLRRFGSGRDRAARGFDEFVDTGRKEPRRPELSGASDSQEAAAVRRALGDSHRVSDGILGGDAFVARVRADAERVEAALSGRNTERRAGPVGRPSVREVIDAALELLDVDPIALEEQPRSQRCAQVKRLAIWVWVHEYAGQQIEVARALELDTGVVSRYYGQAIAAAGEFDQQASALTALLNRRRRPRHRAVTKAAAGAAPVRYHVDVDEA